MSTLIYPQPGTPQFQRYKRCIWELEGQPEDDEDGKLDDLLRRLVSPLIGHR